MRRLLQTLLLLILVACGDRSGSYAAFLPGPAPVDLNRGEVLYNTYCVSCHGRFGRGEGLGPPMLDSTFFPGHLPDNAWVRAVTQGAPQSNYHFGAMPPVKPIDPAEVPEILRYVHWLQRRASELGIAPPTAPRRP
ncbi:MAG TPA: cytochrome c [Gemmatimonadales bacterium]|nr:cytochrome c [Gemmatimonadales bacterium]